MFGMRRFRRAFEAAEERAASRHAPGDRVVWRGLMMDGARRPVVYAGTVLAQSPDGWVTVQLDGAPTTAQLKPERLWPEAEYRGFVERGARPPDAWG